MRVGGAKITQANLTMQMTALAPDHVVPDPPRFKKCTARLAAQTPEPIAGALVEECRQQYGELRQRALRLLISAQWLIGEAVRRKFGAPDGTPAERAQTAESMIREALKRSEPQPTQAQVAGYYKQNMARYERREKRNIDIVERLPTKAAATSALNKVVSRHDMAKVAIHESFENTPVAETVPWKRAILKAIFTVKPHTLIGPLPLNEKWCFFEVTRVVPRVVKPLVEVQGAIQQQLAGEQQRRTLALFISAWRRRWIARTDCSPGYVVQKCRQYKGPKSREDTNAFS